MILLESKFYCAHVLADSCATNANENSDLVTAALHVWRLEGEIIRTAHCCVVYNCCAQLCAHKYQHFLNSCVVRFRFSLCRFFKRFSCHNVSKVTYIISSGTHTHTRLTALFPGLPGWAGTRKVKPIWILLKQETVSGSGIGWAICKSASRSSQITMLVPHRSFFLQAGCPSCRPTNSVKALKAGFISSGT